MSHSIPKKQEETIAMLQSNRIASSLCLSLPSSLFSEILALNTPERIYIPEEINNKNDTSSHIRALYIPNELLDSMKEQRLKRYLSAPEH